MELGLSLGDPSKPFTFAEESKHRRVSAKDLSFWMGLSIGSAPVTAEEETGEEEEYENGENNQFYREEEDSEPISIDGSFQLGLFPHTPVHRIPPTTVQILHWHRREGGSYTNRKPSTEPVDGESPPPYEAANAGGGDNDDDENGGSRKKLRLSKEQSAFLEESFKEHNTLNPKQKLAVANQLNLRPRQVEVWFQNRRARTKLKQTEVDCEFLKNCCKTLTVENRRLHKELQELRALKSNSSLYMQSPATTLTMCPSCERVSPSTAGAAVFAAGASKTNSEPPIKPSSGLAFSKPKSYS